RHAASAPGGSLPETSSGWRPARPAPRSAPDRVLPPARAPVMLSARISTFSKACQLVYHIYRLYVSSRSNFTGPRVQGLLMPSCYLDWRRLALPCAVDDA